MRPVSNFGKGNFGKGKGKWKGKQNGQHQSGRGDFKRERAGVSKSANALSKLCDHVSVTINNHELLALVDTGATRSFIGQNLVSEFGFPTSPTEPFVVEFAGGAEEHVVNCVQGTVILDGAIKHDLDLGVLCDYQGVILGRDWMRDNQVVYNTKDNTIEVNAVTHKLRPQT